jgi:hypothetical protein
MSKILTGDQYVELDGKLAEIKRQMRQPDGYPFDPEKLSAFLQRAIEGRFRDGAKWIEESGVITIVLPATDGTTGEQWITRTEKKGNRTGDYAKQLLRSPDFKPTIGVVYTVKVLKGELFSDSGRITKDIRAEAKKRKFLKPNAEVACLLREYLSDEELEAMGLWWIVVMHEPIKDSGGDLRLLGVDRRGVVRWLGSYYGHPVAQWNLEGGFLFLAPQVGTQA